MGNLTEIIISAVDQSSAVFDQIANSADSSFSEVSAAADASSIGIDNMENAADSAEASLNNTATAADSADTALNSVDSTSLNEASSAASSLGSNLQEVSNDASNVSTGMGDAASSTSMFQAAGAGIVALGLGAALTESVNAAGNYTDSWSRMGEAVGSTSSTVKADWSGAISVMTETTGRGAGTIRNYITEMGIAGVTSQSAISSSFSGIAGAAYVTGSSIETISSSFERVVSTGKLGSRQLISMGLNSQDVMNSTGMSVDQVSDALATMDSTGRAAFMSQIMNAKYGQTANDEYKTSWQGVTDKLGLAESYISRIFGGLILPVAIPALVTATGVLNSIGGVIGGLPGPLQTVASVVTVGIIGWVLLYTTWMTVSSVAGAMGLSLAGLTGGLIGNTAATEGNVIAKNASKVADIASAGATAIRNAALTGESSLSITALGAAMAHTTGIEANTVATNAGALSYARSAITLGAQTVATGAQTAATYMAEGAQWALNLAMDANPIMIVVLAIMGLVAILFYLYNTNETVRGAIDWLWASLQSLGSYIMGGLMAAWTALTSALSPITSALGLLWAAIIQVWSTFASSQSSQASGIFSQIAGAVMQLWNALSGLVTMVIGMLMPYLQILWQFLSGAFMAVWVTISGVVMAFINYIATLITIFANLIAGNITVGQALQQIWGAIQLLFAQVFMAILLGIGQFAAGLINYGIQAASGLLNNFIAYISLLPGTAWGYFLQFLSYLASLPGSAAGYAASVGSTIVSTIASYLTSLPGQMYSWGMNALQRFVNGIIDTIPGLRGALDTVSSLFPHSPPKEGPLATIKDENMERFGSSLTESMSEGLEDGAGDSFGFITPGSVKVSRNDSNTSSGSDGKIKELKVTFIHDFINVPTHLDKETLKEALKGMTYDLGWIDTLIKTLSYGKVITKANLGA